MNTSSDKCVLAIDLGSSGPKISIVNQRGEILATRSGTFETIYAENGRAAEQDAEGWWKQILQLSKEVIDESNAASRIVAIGNCAQYATSIPVDENGNALHNAIMWEDSRAGKHISKVMGGFPSLLGYNIFKLLKWVRAIGIPPILSGVDGGSHMLLLKNEMPEVWKKTCKVLQPSDFLSMKLTGKFTTNENTGFLYALINIGAWSEGKFNLSLIKSLGLDESKFPEVVPVCSNLGKVTEKVRQQLGLNEDVAVFSGMQDTTACAIGGGAFNDYDLVIEIGTTLNTGVLVPKRIIDILKGVFSVGSPIPGKFILVGEPGSGAKALNYLLNSFFRLDDRLSRVNIETDLHYAAIADNMAAESPVGSNGVVFMPWVYGTTFPEPDANMRGGFINLNQRTSRSDLIRAVYESYAMNFKWVLEITEAKLGRKFTKAHFTGGGAQWETAAQICADALQIPIYLMDEPRQANTKGIAYVCFNNLGIVSYEEMKQHLKVKKVYEPNPENFAAYNKQLTFYKKLFKTMRPLYKELNG
jgi:xylulokinase